MRTRAPLTVFLLLAGLSMGAGPQAALDKAQAALEARRPEEVLFALDGMTGLAAAEAGRAADLLAGAARVCLDQQDGILALQLCQMALGHQSAHAEGLVACIRAAQDLAQLDPAEAYTRRLREAHPQDPRGGLFAARLAVTQGEWGRAVREAEGVRADPRADEAMRQEARALGDRSKAELTERAVALTEVEALTVRLEAARRARLASPAPGKTPPGARREVVLYVTRWCGYCTKAKKWLRARKVPFETRDIERDRGAVEELAEKADRAGVKPGGVPVVDVAGDLVLGWSPGETEKLLRKHGLLD